MSSPFDHVVECIAMAICWGEFVSKRDDTPEAYWQRVSPKMKNEYRQEARCYAAAIRGGAWVLMPRHPTWKQIKSARTVRPALRQDGHVLDVWNALLNDRPRLNAAALEEAAHAEQE